MFDEYFRTYFFWYYSYYTRKFRKKINDILKLMSSCIYFVFVYMIISGKTTTFHLAFTNRPLLLKKEKKKKC